MPDKPGAEQFDSPSASMVVMGEHEIAKAMLKEIAVSPQVETVAVSIEPELHTEKA